MLFDLLVILIATSLLKFFYSFSLLKVSVFFYEFIKRSCNSYDMLNLINIWFFVFLKDWIGQLMTDRDHIGGIKIWISRDPIINIFFWVLLIPSVLACAADVLSFTCIFEFWCSQAIGMHGILIWLFWFYKLILFLQLLWCFNMDIILMNLEFCHVWHVFISVIGLPAIISLIVSTLVAHWYVLRIWHNDRLCAVIESHFYHLLMQQEVDVFSGYYQ